jgi:hypothetical protein
MGKRISAASPNAKAELPEQVPNGCVKPAEAGAENANDHQQQARVHPALPCYCVVVSGAGALESIDVAVSTHMGTATMFRKGWPRARSVPASSALP